MGGAEAGAGGAGDGGSSIRSRIVGGTTRPGAGIPTAGCTARGGSTGREGGAIGGASTVGASATARGSDVTAAGGGLTVLMSRGGGSGAAVGGGGSGARGEGFLPFTTGVSAKMAPDGSDRPRCRASRSTN
jgi:hypothetical protein